MSDILEIIKDRRSIRKFNDKPVEEENLSKIIEAGRWAPTGGNSQSVHFFVIQNADILREIRGLVQDSFAKMELKEDMYVNMQNSIRMSKQGTYVYDYNAPILIVVTNEKGYPNAMADSACALQNMMLTAHSLGVGSCWINQLHWLDEDPVIREYIKGFGIEDNETICGSLALGHYDGTKVRKDRIGMKVNYIR